MILISRRLYKLIRKYIIAYYIIAYYITNCEVLEAPHIEELNYICKKLKINAEELNYIWRRFTDET